MPRIIISERQLDVIKRTFFEEIDPTEVKNNYNNIQAVIDGRRNIGFLASVYNAKFLDILDKAGIKYIPINNGQSYVFYRPEAKEDAMKLASIARKNDGYLPFKTPEETYTIGILLGYNKEAVKTFVKEKFPNFIFH